MAKKRRVSSSRARKTHTKSAGNSLWPTIVAVLAVIVLAIAGVSMSKGNVKDADAAADPTYTAMWNESEYRFPSLSGLHTSRIKYVDSTTTVVPAQQNGTASKPYALIDDALKSINKSSGDFIIVMAAGNNIQKNLQTVHLSDATVYAAIDNVYSLQIIRKGAVGWPLLFINNGSFPVHHLRLYGLQIGPVLANPRVVDPTLMFSTVNNLGTVQIEGCAFLHKPIIAISNDVLFNFYNNFVAGAQDVLLDIRESGARISVRNNNFTTGYLSDFVKVNPDNREKIRRLKVVGNDFDKVNAFSDLEWSPVFNTQILIANNK